nr:MAG TPA: hypothetical protein [Caudoviricetes sp.]
MEERLISNNCAILSRDIPSLARTWTILAAIAARLVGVFSNINTKRVDKLQKKFEN